MNIDKVNYLNIGLMVLSVMLAFLLPFKLFLFSYAVLGPLHYLTEISWLHDRKYFATTKWDYLLLVALCIPILLGTGLFKAIEVRAFNKWGTAITIFAFGMSLIFVLTKKPLPRILGGLAILAFSLGSKFLDWNWAYLTFSVFLPTLLHVYVFTGAFILFGALKSQSKTGYLSFAVFIGCAFLLFFAESDFQPKNMVTAYVREAYEYFAILNVHVADLFGMHKAEAGIPETFVLYPFSAYEDIFSVKASVIISRFISFAYTYHYLNWFSKTSVIKWHKVPKIRFAIVIAAWIASVAFYSIDYKLGFAWLFLLSFMHVFLEFPLNWRSFIGIGEELGKRFRRTPVPQSEG